MLDRVGGGFKDYAPLMLRLGLATIFILQGAYLVPEMGHSPHLHKIVEMVVELLGGLFLLIGFMTRWAAFALAVLMIYVIADGPQLHALTRPSEQLPFACLVMAAASFGLGGGKYSIDENQKKKKEG